ncbi:MAG: hypothetical protein ABIJ40_16840 [Bacteroidota bacterium]|nr:hypothetical protein [Bacteroidota bacterium]
MKKEIVNENGEYLKMRRLTVEDENEFKDFMRKAEKALDEKSYSSAKDLFKKADALKPADKNAKNQLAKIEEILFNLETLHQKHFGK